MGRSASGASIEGGAEEVSIYFEPGDVVRAKGEIEGVR
jgi:hypothetical protein